MNSKIKIPLVIFSLLMVLGICSATIYYFNTRETKNNGNTVNSETVEKDVSKINNENQDNVSTEQDLSDEVKTNEEQKVDSNSDNPKEDNSKKEEKIDTTKNNSSSGSNTTSKQTSSNSSSVEQNTTSSNNEQQTTESNTNNGSKQEEQNSSNNIKIYEVPDEDNKDNVASFENDEEYIKLKAQMEFETRAECNAASDIIGPQYAELENFRNTVCESFAYKGTVIGYRLQIWFKDNTWIYNNS